MLTIRLPENLETRLSNLVTQIKETKSFYVMEKVMRCIEDLENIYLSEKAHEEFVLSGNTNLSADEVRKTFGFIPPP